jgi:hypothetical protein
MALHIHSIPVDCIMLCCFQHHVFTLNQLHQVLVKAS